MGEIIPAYLIFRSAAISQFAVTDLDSQTRFAHSATGFSDAELTLDYLRHFNVQSFKCSSSFSRTGYTFETWFGVDEKSDRDPDEFPFSKRNQADNKIFRILYIDGFKGHCVIEVLAYAAKYNYPLLPYRPPPTLLTTTLI